MVGHQGPEGHPICTTVKTYTFHMQVSYSQTIVNVGVRAHAVDEEVVLVHVHLNARSSAIEVEKGLSTML